MLTTKLQLQLLGDPLPGLCPWTPLGDYRSLDPCYVPPTVETDGRHCSKTNVVFRLIRRSLVVHTCARTGMLWDIALFVLLYVFRWCVYVVSSVKLKVLTAREPAANHAHFRFMISLDHAHCQFYTTVVARYWRVWCVRCLFRYLKQSRKTTVTFTTTMKSWTQPRRRSASLCRRWRTLSSSTEHPKLNTAHIWYDITSCDICQQQLIDWAGFNVPVNT